ncbi:hypothetical protein JMF89_09320 [Clostridiaceae bacterium UIB06]|uniref:Uncharacterized protein n=1 Tax=Clostridium thailandense TaxID=2794346 RepID=A0A949TZT9_9CLOT|nr:hypothetical protein [Clostridium thailandense]MBV7274690.1 hypothetical protein [Clostridium thailandense]MCH5137399.1 hypothetical protein [Clostridiaceae bacterium UIB06]
MLLLIIISYTAMGFYEFIPLYKEKKWKDLKINAALFLSSCIVAVLLGLKVYIPSPAKPIQDLIISVFGK